MKEKEKKEKRGILPDILNNQSVFGRIFLSLLALLTILILVITFWINHISSRNQQLQIMRSNISRMEAADRTLEQVFDDLSSSMTQLMWNRSLLNYLLLPTPESYSDISQQLTNVSRSTWAVKQITFYSNYTNKVFQSSVSRVLEREAFSDHFLLEMDWETDPNCVLYYTNQERRTRTYLITSGGRLFLLQNLFMGKSLGSVIYELNTAIVSSTISNSNSEPDSIVYLYDQNGAPVLTGVLTYDRLSSDSLEKAGVSVITPENADSYRLHGGEQYYRTVGNRIPWVYLMKVNPGEMRVSLRDSITTWLPAMGIMLIASILITLYIVRTIYRPVNRLLELSGQKTSKKEYSEQKKAGEEQPEAPAVISKNEFDVLENIYSRAIGYREQMVALIETAVPDILDSMLRGILNGQPGYTDEKMEETLEGFHSPIPVQGRFLLITCEMSELPGRTITDTEREMYRDSLRRLLETFSGREYVLHRIHMDDYTTVLLLSFPKDSSAVTIKKAFVEIQRSLKGKEAVLPYRIWVESGQIYQHLSDSYEAYQEGKEKIRYLKNRLENAAEDPGEIIEENAAGSREIPGGQRLPDRFWFRERTDEIVSLVVKGERSAASLRMDQTTAEIRERVSSLEELKSGYDKLLESMMEKVIAYPLTREEQELLEGGNVAERIRGTDDPEVLQIFVLERCRQICHMIYTYNRKNRYKYVDQAKAYIAEHYTDSDLSLNDVGEHIGISGSYLSELWSEQNGEKFTSYLASYRVEKARQLLRSTQDPVKEVGMRCGFNSVQNFNRVFKKHTGMTPGQYRDSGNR